MIPRIDDVWRGCRRALALCAAIGLLAASAPADASVQILVFGDSLSAAHGMPRKAGWTALLAKRIRKHDLDASVMNASVSGETTAGGLARLPAALEHSDPDIVVLELGGNDGLRALPPPEMRANLSRMIAMCRAHRARVLLLGMRIPSNYGPAYTQRFHRVFEALVARTGVAFDPFFLAPIAADRSNFQADGIHPTAAAQPLLLDRLWPRIEPLIREARAAGPAPSAL